MLLIFMTERHYYLVHALRFLHDELL